MNGANQPAGGKGGSAKLEAKLEIPYREKISRLFIFRNLWIFIMVWPIMFWSIWIGIINFAHFWYMLILGKRHEALWKKNVRFFRHLTKWQAYFQLHVDKRPEFVED